MHVCEQRQLRKVRKVEKLLESLLRTKKHPALALAQELGPARKLQGGMTARA